MLSATIQTTFPHLLAVLLNSVPTPTGMTSVLSLATVALASAFLVLLVARTHPTATDARSTTGPRTRAIALRERSRHSAQLRLRDPDAPGRTRPRAPGQLSPAG